MVLHVFGKLESEILCNRSTSLETKFDLKSQLMGIVSVSSSPEKPYFVTSSIDGTLCVRSSQTGIISLSAFI